MPTFSLHSHSTFSIRDSIVNIDRLAEKIKANGGTHYSVSDHGTIQGWLALRDACQKHKLTPVYSAELYVNDLLPSLQYVRAQRETAAPKTMATTTLQAIQSHALPTMSAKQAAYFCGNLNDASDAAATAKQLFNRLAFGYQHLVCTAVNAVGRKNLIQLTNRGWQYGYYFKPQVTTADVISYSEGLIFTTACMGGPIARRMEWDSTGAEAKSYLKQWEFAKDRFYLEVQPLDLINQRVYNEQLIALSTETGFPLILSQDNHHINEEDWFAHRILMLNQNDKTIKEIENLYTFQGAPTPFSELKTHFGCKTTWETQLVIQQQALPLAVKAGHHYGDVKLHWRTNDAVRRQIVTTNPELLPVVDRCFAVTDRLCTEIQDIKWPSKYRLQKYPDARSKIMELCVAALKQQGKVTDQRYIDWIRKEDKVISACGFWDYIWTLYVWTKKVQEEGIPIGYARGSGGGCLTMYLLGIIRVDPVKYGLFFERFLNPARLGLDPNTLEKVKEASSCPDVDLDFSSIHRPRVIQIAEELFGKDRVIPVGTMTESKLKTALADLCRVLEIPQTTYMPASKELPEDATNSLTFEQASAVPAFKEFLGKYAIIAKHLPSLIGPMRSIGQHAGGVCIADVPIAEETPVVRSGSKEGSGLVTGFGESGAERALESVGFIKFDALATDTVDHVSLCSVALHKQHLAAGGSSWVKPGEKMLYPEQIPHFTENDPAVMKAIFYAGNTDGVFQMEESIGKDMCKLVKPDTIEEIADISTMIRPGCLQAPCRTYEIDEDGDQKQIDGTGLQFEYVARKFRGVLNPPPDLPQEILDVLKPTHYCCIYQEQMMFLIRVLTGGKMSLGEGDLYRRACEHAGKGKQEWIEKLAKLEQDIKKASPYPPDLVDRVCMIIKGGANYAFNKSHSLSYSLFSYAQAWFKHYYPHIFYASHVTLLAAKNKLTKVHKIVNNARSSGIVIKSPHVLRSGDEATWSADGKTVYLPFTVVKGLKDATAKALQTIAPACTTLEDVLVACVANKDIKKNHLLSLAQVGGLDDLGYPRIHALAMTSYVLARTTGKSTPEMIRKYCADAATFQVVGTIDPQRSAEAEVAVFGGFVNECPLDPMVENLEAHGWSPLSQIEPGKEQTFQVYFMITSITKKVHKSGKSIGKEWLKLTCWDGLEVCELSVWAHDLDGKLDENGDVAVAGYRHLIRENSVYCAVVQADGERPVSLARRDKDEVLFRKS